MNLGFSKNAVVGERAKPPKSESRIRSWIVRDGNKSEGAIRNLLSSVKRVALAWAPRIGLSGRPTGWSTPIGLKAGPSNRNWAPEAGLRALLAHRELIFAFVRRDLVGQYRGSVLGLLWSFLNPLFMLAIYTIVFSVFMRLGEGRNVGTPYYSLFIFSGMVPWMAFSEAVNLSTKAVISNAGLVKKTVFPTEILPVVAVITGFVRSLFAMAILLAAIVFAPGQPLRSTIPLLAVVMVPQLIFSIGLGWLLASLCVFVRDLGEMVKPLLMAWWFMTPVLYPSSLVPERLEFVVRLNPMAILIDNYRRLLITGQLPSWWALAGLTVVVSAFAWFGYFWFNRCAPWRAKRGRVVPVYGLLPFCKARWLA